VLTVWPPCVLRELSLRAVTRALSRCKRLMGPSERFSLLAMGRVMGELSISTGDPAIDKARKMIVNKDAAGNMNDD
jgi:hypothetical protein